MTRMKTNGISKLSRQETFSSSDGGEEVQVVQENITVTSSDLCLSLLLLQEARAVSLWSCLVIFLRLFVMSLVHLATPTTSSNQEYLVVASLLASALVACMPYKVATLTAPGFILAHPWLLFWVEKKTGVLPNVPTRCAEYMLGRLKLGQLVLVLLVHFGCVILTASFWNEFLPDHLASLALAPILYQSASASNSIPSLWIVVRYVLRVVCVWNSVMDAWTSRLRYFRHTHEFYIHRHSSHLAVTMFLSFTHTHHTHVGFRSRSIGQCPLSNCLVGGSGSAQIESYTTMVVCHGHVSPL